MLRFNVSLLRFRVGGVLLAGCLLLCLWPALVQARPAPHPVIQDAPGATPVPAEEGAADEEGSAVAALRRVKVNFFINSISHVNDEAGSYDLDCYLDFYWYEPALEGKRVEDIDPATLWDPALEPINSLDYQLLGRTYTNSLEPRTNVRLSYRLVGVFQSNFDLRKFPFDDQIFTLQLESAAYDSGQLLFDFIDNDSPTIYGDQPLVNSVARGKYLVPDFQIPEWTINDLQIVQQIRVLPYDKSSWAQFRVDLPATRQSSSYVWRVIVEMMILLAFCWGVLFLESRNLRYRLLVLCLLFMATVLFNFLLQQNQPSTPYLTFPDRYILLAYVTVGMLGATVVIIKLLYERERDLLAQRLNNLARLVYPIVLIIVNVILFWNVLG